MKIKYLLLFSIFYIILESCEKVEPNSIANENTLGGNIDDLSLDEMRQFLNGDNSFTEVFTSSKGLGPLFVSNSCESCHLGDGKGTPSTTLTRFGQFDHTGNQFLNLGGPQLQNRAIVGYSIEKIPTGATFSNFTPPAVTGLGYLQFVTDADIIAMADPNDNDGDGISGIPHWNTLKDFVTPLANAISQNGMYIHRFGKKAGAYDLLDQTVNAYNQDMGITSTFDPKDTYSGLNTDPEVSDKTIRDIVHYLQTLKAPIQRDKEHSQVIDGKSLFNQISCASCHRPSLKTGYSHISALSFKEFSPYTDLLLHDMGSGLDDGYTEGNAKTSEWRTPPLWGLGLSKSSQGGKYFLMHDGRARSIEEAILLHGGEASNSKIKYNNLSKQEKEAIIKFLESL